MTNDKQGQQSIRILRSSVGEQEQWLVAVVPRRKRYPSFSFVLVGTAVKTRHCLSQPLTSAQDVMFQYTLSVDLLMKEMKISDGVTIAKLVPLLLHFND